MNMPVIALILILTIFITAPAESSNKITDQIKTPSAETASPAKSNAIKPFADPATGMEFVFVKGGCFQMGDTSGDGDKDEQPVHEVCLSDYYIGKYEVTQRQWQKVMGKNPSSRKECGEECPVEYISWNNVQEFILKIITISKLNYRLPTEAEWEFAARSGGKFEKWAGTSIESSLKDFSWLGANSNSTMQKVGQKKPNGIDVYDMSGNAIEWCQDWYGADYYSASPKENPTGPATGQKRVLRGGDYGREPKELRNAQRKSDDADMLDGNYGFRLVRPAN